jgi:hypothetical protein
MQGTPMGMFDYVNVEMPCPHCDKPMRGFQTKDSACEMDTVDPDGIANLYATCQNCKRWIEFSRPTPSQPRETPFTREEIEAMGFAFCFPSEKES